MMADKQDKPLYDEEMMRVIQEKINRSNPKKGSQRYMLWYMLLAVFFVTVMVVAIFPRKMLPIGSFLVCPPDSKLDVTMGEEERYVNENGDVQYSTPVYLNCMRGEEVVKKLTAGAMLLIVLVYITGLSLLVVLAYLIILFYRRKNAEVFETPPPPIPPPGR